MKFLIILASFCNGLIFYDSNLFKGFDDFFNTAFFCQSTSITSQIFFSGSFPKIPKIILTLEKIDTWFTNSQFFLEVVDVQLTYFYLKISCPKQRVFAIRIKWYAICGSSFQVINYMSTTSISNMTFPHSLSNAKNGFVSLIGIQYSGNVDFLLKIGELTNSSISVQITKVDLKFQNLIKISYQVVITELDIINLGLQTTLDIFTSQPIQIQSSSWFIFNLQGLNYFTTDNIRLNLTYTYDSNSLSYQFGKWDGQHTGSYHSQLWLSYQYNSFSCFYNYFSCVHIKTKRTFNKNLNELPDQIISFIDLNQQYITIGQYEFILNQRLSYLQIKVSVKCFIGKIIKSSLHHNKDCEPTQTQMQVIKYQCHKNFNFISFYLGFISDSQPSYQFKLIITNQSIELFQVLLNQIGTEQLILKIEQLDL